MFETIAVGDLEAEWPLCLPHLRRVIDRSAGSVTAATVLEALRCGAFHLWRERDGQNPVVSVTAITHHAEFDALLIVLIGGRGLPRWITAVEAAFGRFALARGCTILEAYARPGLIGATYRERRALLRGWSPASTLIRKSVAAAIMPAREHTRLNDVVP